MASKEDMLEELREALETDNQAITYKWVARHFNLSAARARQVPGFEGRSNICSGRLPEGNTSAHCAGRIRSSFASGAGHLAGLLLSAYIQAHPEELLLWQRDLHDSIGALQAGHTALPAACRIVPLVSKLPVTKATPVTAKAADCPPKKDNGEQAAPGVSEGGHANKALKESAATSTQSEEPCDVKVPKPAQPEKQGEEVAGVERQLNSKRKRAMVGLDDSDGEDSESLAGGNLPQPEQPASGASCVKAQASSEVPNPTVRGVEATKGVAAQPAAPPVPQAGRVDKRKVQETAAKEQEAVSTERRSNAPAPKTRKTETAPSKGAPAGKGGTGAKAAQSKTSGQKDIKSFFSKK
ncbi:hypothetical protein HaLaN_25794 [Haematococcus lacustris]|uniref:DNA polymerase delta subunit 3 n=1 Tax=Haematococcus lacustris TaxID=44745 RepID=A0A6A0A341_HAELA|nr:hypothetical protein HaLaN_25794 [Haematococcus lacustris]